MSRVPGIDQKLKMPPKRSKVERGATENVSLGPQVREGELVFGVARIFARYLSELPAHRKSLTPGSFNDTFVHVTDLRYLPA